MFKIKSIIEQCIQEIYVAQNLEQGQQIMIALIEKTEIKSQDKNKMIAEVKNMKTLTKLQFYATNAMFKFEGLSVNSVIFKPKK